MATPFAPPLRSDGTAAARPSVVWDLQPEVQHYTVPVWDGVTARGAADGAYSLSVLGTLENGEAIGGGKRPYIVECPIEHRRRFGVHLYGWPRFEEKLRRSPPDVLIIGANPRNFDCWRIPRLCRAMGIPVIMWSKVHSYSGFAPIMKRVKPWFYSRFDCAVCYGEASRDELLGYGFPPDRVFVANNTIDTRRVFLDGERIQRRGVELRREAGLEHRRILLCIGRMDPEKRHRDLLSAWPRLRELDPDLFLVIVSGGPLLETIRDQSARIDPERIRVIGRVPEGDDYAWISTCDLGIYPGAVGLAINISMAFGKPTIIADEYGADAEIIQHGVTGWRFVRGDLEDMVGAVGHVLSNPDEVRKVTASARTLMRETVTIENMVANIDKAIRTGLALRGSARKRAG